MTLSVWLGCRRQVGGMFDDVVDHGSEGLAVTDRPSAACAG